jgi:hypothetical protein
MLNVRPFLATASSVAALTLVCSTALADTVPIGAAGPPRPGNQINVGDAMNLSIGAQQGAGEIFRMSYPGFSAPVELTARITGVPAGMMDSVGFDVYDDENQTTVVEHTTLGQNQLNGDPNLMEVAFSANLPQTVTFQFFNWSGAPVTVSVQPVQLPSVPLVAVGPTIPGSATAIGISGVAAAVISH